MFSSLPPLLVLPVLLAGLVAMVIMIRRGALSVLKQMRDLRAFKIVAEHANDGMLLQRMDGTILWCNPAYARLLGRPREFWIGKKPQKWVFPPEICPSDAEIAAFRYDPEGAYFREFTIYENLRGDGSRFHSQFSLAAVDVAGEQMVVLSCRDVSEEVAQTKALERALSQLEQAVNFDALTGLANRRKLLDVLETALAQTEASGAKLGLIHVDLDKFKAINDTHGHAAGDAVLVQAAAALRACLRPSDLAARIGGDEFIVVLPHLGAVPDQLEMIARRILDHMTTPFQWCGIELSYGASLGLATAAPGDDPEELIQKADFALYEVKASGRGDFLYFDAALDDKKTEQKELSDALTLAIRDGQLLFHYQPVVSLKDARIVGVETLVRWHHPERGLVTPAKFLPLAADIGLLTQLDETALAAAITARQTLSRAGFDQMHVSFNASLQSLADPQLVDRMTWAADAADLDQHQLMVEILETAFLPTKGSERLLEGADVRQQISRLCAAGFDVLLDDFGTGYAGLSHLARLDVTGVKVDRSLVAEMGHSTSAAQVLSAVVDLACKLEMMVIAEGVEDAGQARVLHQAGCHLAQGYAFSPPLPLPDLLDWLPQYDPQAFYDHHIALRADSSRRA
ncbi:Cyclic di-GMP phosphodiesterase Gmr [Tritonibacter multivorans]|uniref:Cyclic di-GMP phosphodiesterase Gmr n=1 Tax=Tritonibacter multivorans TaxID=928856 RepID=A0A0N7LZC1_9RHOB|nr:GGDEF and EAL domain-containing protein [Tritonibacter multivorans]MDA7422694.1 EAL domain-containing protein [Tritonibacter multivorans]CUH77249.1 Cyclic di-GMP phosphodiesterase Gmr [Tritonibacter multivorans]SFD53134.1 diguanylate cyclase/phosphodiesterase with PAS/PAC sensor(s) [Tritonibacter multivorans]